MFITKEIHYSLRMSKICHWRDKKCKFGLIFLVMWNIFKIYFMEG